jgi:DNA-binding MarR family transcriptional regulator
MHDHTRPRYRKGSLFGGDFRRLDRNDLAKLLFLAEALDRNSHQPGRHGGMIGRTGLAVLRALITRFYNKQSGRLDPSLEAIARAANVARSTVQEAITRLELAGLIERFRRIYRTRVVLCCQLTGRPYEAIRVLQDTNGYRLNVPVPYRAEHGDLAAARKKPRVSSDTESRSGTTDIFILNAPSLDDPTSAALRASLERLNRAITARKATA